MYRVRTIFTGPSGAPWVNTLFFAESGGTAQDAANAVGDFWSNIDAIQSNAISWTTEADVVLVNEDTGLATGVTATTPVSGAGGASDEMLPVASQALIRLLTGVFNDGRQIRGRIFVPGLTETSNTTGGILSGTAGVGLSDAVTNLIGDADSELVVWSRSGLQAHPAIAGTVWNQFAVLRSRRD